MASYVHQYTKKEILDGNVDLVADSGVKVGLAKSTFADNPDDDFLNDAFSAAECDFTNYTGGFAGAGRKSISGRAFNIDDTDNEVEFDFTDPSWTSAGGASNNTIGAVVLMKEITNDAASLIVASDDVADLVTNGSDITYTVHAEGMINF